MTSYLLHTTAKLYNDFLICSVHDITVKSTKPMVYKPKPTQTLSFSIFPNPTDGLTHILINQVPEKEFVYVITDILGRELYREKRYMDSNRHSLDMQSYDTGVYLLRVLDGQETIYKSQGCTTNLTKRKDC